jgi:3-dehydroquinate dehydratase-2
LARVFVLNGINLGSLGERRPEVYGTQTLGDIEDLLRAGFPDVDFEFRQTDYELVVNTGAWTHYSYAIHDALEAVSVPKVEVHLSNVHARDEGWRRESVVSPVVDATVAGMGASGYLAAVRYVLER